MNTFHSSLPILSSMGSCGVLVLLVTREFLILTKFPLKRKAYLLKVYH